MITPSAHNPAAAPPWSAPDSIGHAVWSRLRQPGATALATPTVLGVQATAIHDRHVSFLDSLTVAPLDQGGARRSDDTRVFRRGAALAVVIDRHTLPAAAPRAMLVGSASVAAAAHDAGPVEMPHVPPDADSNALSAAPTPLPEAVSSSAPGASLRLSASATSAGFEGSRSNVARSVGIKRPIVERSMPQIGRVRASPANGPVPASAGLIDARLPSVTVPVASASPSPLRPLGDLQTDAIANSGAAPDAIARAQFAGGAGDPSSRGPTASRVARSSIARDTAVASAPEQAEAGLDPLSRELIAGRDDGAARDSATGPDLPLARAAFERGTSVPQHIVLTASPATVFDRVADPLPFPRPAATLPLAQPPAAPNVIAASLGLSPDGASRGTFAQVSSQAPQRPVVVLRSAEGARVERHDEPASPVVLRHASAAAAPSPSQRSWAGRAGIAQTLASTAIAVPGIAAPSAHGDIATPSISAATHETATTSPSSGLALIVGVGEMPLARTAEHTVQRAATVPQTALIADAGVVGAASGANAAAVATDAPALVPMPAAVVGANLPLSRAMRAQRPLPITDAVAPLPRTRAPPTAVQRQAGGDASHDELIDGAPSDPQDSTPSGPGRTGAQDRAPSMPAVMGGVNTRIGVGAPADESAVASAGAAPLPGTSRFASAPAVLARARLVSRPIKVDRREPNVAVGSTRPITLIELSSVSRMARHVAARDLVAQRSSIPDADAAASADAFAQLAPDETLGAPAALPLARWHRVGVSPPGVMQFGSMRSPSLQGGAAMPFLDRARAQGAAAPPFVVARDAAPVSAPHELLAAAPMPGPVALPPAPSQPAAAPPRAAGHGMEVDLDDLVDRAWQALMSRLVIEQERRGFGRWS